MSNPLARVAICLSSAVVLILPAHAGAQFGGLIKKATEKAAGRAEQKAADRLIPDAKLGSPFTVESLDRVITALEMTASARAESDSIGRVIEPLDKQLADLRSRSDAEIDAYFAKHNQWDQCADDAKRAYSNAHEGATKAAAEQMAAKYRADPLAGQRLAADMGKMQTAANAALAKGDTAGMKRIMEEWYRKNGIEAALGIPDAELRAKCGVDAPPPTSKVQRDALEAKIGALRTQQRESAEAAAEKARLASGLPAAEFYPMNERVERWYAIAVERRKGNRFWSDDEGALFESRRARIEKVFRTLRAQK